MANFGRRLGYNIDRFMLKEGIQSKEFAKKLNCSEKDVWNIIEGKIVVTPDIVERIATILGTRVEELLHFDSEFSIPDLECSEYFISSKNQDKILDLIDEYVELVES